MVILKTPSVAFNLGDLSHVILTGPDRGVYLKSFSGSAFKIASLPDDELAAIGAALDGASPAAIRLIPCPHNAADAVTVLNVAVPAAPGGGG